MTAAANRDALFVAAALVAAPLLWAADDLRSGLQLGGAVAAILTLLQLLSLLTRTAATSNAFATACWATVTAATASWLLAAYGLIAPNSSRCCRWPPPIRPGGAAAVRRPSVCCWCLRRPWSARCAVLRPGSLPMATAASSPAARPGCCRRPAC